MKTQQLHDPRYWDRGHVLFRTLCIGDAFYWPSRPTHMEHIVFFQLHGRHWSLSDVFD